MSSSIERRNLEAEGYNFVKTKEAETDECGVVMLNVYEKHTPIGRCARIGSMIVVLLAILYEKVSGGYGITYERIEMLKVRLKRHIILKLVIREWVRRAD